MEAVASDLTDEVLPLAIGLLRRAEDSWDKTNALEAIAGKSTHIYHDQVVSVIDQIDTSWMAARVASSFLETYSDHRKIIELVSNKLLTHLLKSQDNKRDELLWSVDVHLFKNPYMTGQTLTQMVDHIIEVCDEWSWSLLS